MTRFLITAAIVLTALDIYSQTEKTFQNGTRTQNEKKYDSAEYYFNQFINIETNKTRKAYAYLQLGLIQSQLEKPSQAIKLLDKAIELDEQYVYYFYRGRFNYQNKKIEKAITDYGQAIRLKPDYASAYTWRGVAKYWNARIKEGCEDISKGAALGDEEAKSMIPKLCK